MILKVSLVLGDIRSVELDSLESLSKKEKRHIREALGSRLIRDVNTLPAELQLKIIDEVLGCWVEKAQKKRKYRPRNPEKYKLQLEFNRVRGGILKRDGYACQECDSRDFLHVHHIKPLSAGGDNSENNLITLCRKCHKEKHKYESVANIM